MDNRTKNDIQRAMKQIDNIITDLNINMSLCDMSEVHHYEMLINDLSAVQGEHAVEVSV